MKVEQRIKGQWVLLTDVTVVHRGGRSYDIVICGVNGNIKDFDHLPIRLNGVPPQNVWGKRVEDRCVTLDVLL